MTWTPRIGDDSLPPGLKSIKNNEILLESGFIAYFNHKANRWFTYNPHEGGRETAKAQAPDWSPL